jgi:hypothetical protein
MSKDKFADIRIYTRISLNSKRNIRSGKKIRELSRNKFRAIYGYNIIIIC